MRKLSDLLLVKKARDKNKRSRMHTMPDGSMMKGAMHLDNEASEPRKDSERGRGETRKMVKPKRQYKSR